MIRILQIVPNMHSAGLENLLMNIYRNIDREKVQFDFLVHYSGKYDFDDEIERLGGRIFHFPVMEDKNVLKYYGDLKDFFDTHNEYRVIHGHMPSLGFIYMSAAKTAGIPVRIMHSHNASVARNIKGQIKGITVRMAKYPSTLLLACSKKAGYFQYGTSKFEIMHNVIDAAQFSYDESVRADVRKELDLGDGKVILHIGRFTKQKNHSFLISVFEEYLQINHNSILLLMGEGELLEQVKNIVKQKGLEKSVLFLGVRDDAWRIYQAADLFILPSLHEGLPVVGIETQAAGLFSLMSSEVTDEVDVTGLVRFLPLSKTPKEWASEIADVLSTNKKRENTYEMIVRAGYDICHEAEKIQKMYMSLYETANRGRR
jgi:glycosyltransferase involved in cell wall biosynthesis